MGYKDVMAITTRDIEILKFINFFGKSYPDVLGKTFFNGLQQAKNRLTSLKKMEMIDTRNTGLVKPRNALVLTSQGRSFLSDRGVDPRTSVKIHVSTIEHNVIEQVCYYWLKRIGEVERTTVYHHSETLNHVPDMIYEDGSGRKFYIEVELNQKSMNNYNEILERTRRDDPFAVVYVTQTPQKAISLARNMPKWTKLYYVDVDAMIENIKWLGKMQPEPQEALAVRLF